MGDRWGSFEDTAKLRERITVIETNLPLMRAEMDRQFRQLSDGQTVNRAYTEEKFDELALLLRSGSPAKAQNDKLMAAVLAVGGITTLILIMLVIYWLYAITGGRIV